MDFGISTVFNIIGKGISLAKAIWKIINDVKGLEKKRGQLQRQVNVLISILDSIRIVDTLKDPRVASELQRGLGNLDTILEEIGETVASLDLNKAIEALMSFTGKEESFLKRLFRKVKQAKEVGQIVFTAEGKAKLLATLDQRLKLALSIVQIGFSCTQVRQIRHVGVSLTAGFRDLNFVTDDTLEIYTNPYDGGDIPKPVTDVKAEVNSQRLIVSWNDSPPESSQPGTAPKYEVRYHESKHLIVTCNKSPVALGSHRIKPWQDYAIQVRAVNSAGASSWSFPPVYVRMNEGAPTAPGLVVFETPTQRSLNVITEKPHEEQGVTHIIVEKLRNRGNKFNWKMEEAELDADSDLCEHTLTGLKGLMEYLVRVRFRNKFDVSAPSPAFAVRIMDMLPNEPTELELIPDDFDRPAPIIRFKPPSVNPGAVSKFLISLKETKASTTSELTVEIDGSEKVDEETGFIMHTLPSGMLIDRSSETKYELMVRAVARRGTFEAVGELFNTGVEKSMDNFELSARFVADKLKVSTTFTDWD